ncbi:hypothetical protein MG293_011182 [Ovis ammon polii]|uniref:Uncharacterized protein n=1 Tax=Ovis ammon polii TaxID=230172 RepID=A0AAD4Y5Y4_OVIAM|nr:hypothetical protein MG293_011182 [Ovis ammon polii]
MRPVSPEEKPNPMQDANICSRLFWWLNPLFKIGHEQKLKQDDMYSVLPEDRSQHLGEELQGHWDQEVKTAQKDAREPSLMKAILKCYWKSCLVLGIFTFLEEGTRVVQPIFLGKMVSYIENYNSSDSAALHEAYGYAAGLSACVLVWAVLHHLYFYHIQRAGMRLRVAMCHMIYRKSLHLSSSAMGKTTTGQIVNLMSNDVNRFDQVTVFLHYLWMGPLQAVAVTALLWMEIGMSCLAGMAVLIILLLLQSCFGVLFSSLRKEISRILKSSYLRGMNLASFFAISKIMIFVTFITNELLDNRISASQVFVVVTLIEALRFSSTLYFPMAVEKVSEAVVSIRRIKNFLLLDEIPQVNTQLPSDGEVMVDMQDFTAFWDEESETPTLQGLSFTVRPGELLAVVGPVGAGKSSLLSALLGELPPSQGKVSVLGKIAYVSQQPWLFPGTVKSNILFGKKYEEERYKEVIKACALEEDLQNLKERDLTVTGDGGTPLSEGQKARVSLARAVYQDADIYLLDDPLSAVDTEVSRHLFEQRSIVEKSYIMMRCIRQALKEKVTILVTHQLQYLEDASQILILKDGKTVKRGTYSEFLKSRVDILSLFDKGNKQSEPSPVPGTPTLISKSLGQSLQSRRPSLKDAAPEDEDTENIQVTLPLEDQLEGKVEFKTYASYFTAGAPWPVIIFLILVNIAAQVAYVLQDWWLLNWANVQSGLYLGTYVEEAADVMFVLNWFLGVYSGLTVSTILFGITRSLLLFYVLANASQTLHNKMLESILRAPVLFFNRNSIGRILNRFSKDIGHMDDLLPQIFQDFIQWYFLRTSRDVKRLESAAQSPVFSHLASSLRGLGTIRAYKAEHEFQKLFDAHQDLRSGLFKIKLKEVIMISVERGIEYIDLEKEAPWELEYRPPPSWPHEGRIYFTYVNVKYSLDGPLILKNLDTLIDPREKRGIVGRTGAGKSSLIAALFRLSEPEEPDIWIDGIWTTNIGLHDLRKKMSVAPQEPVLFTGRVRNNLDPFNEHTDEELWNALEEVQLKDIFEHLPGKMNTELAESGLNLSVGQRQLVCLARTILKKNQILIIDKATSNVDPRTDELIQKKIHEKFAHCTVLTITHRLSNVIDCQRISVLDSGTRKETGQPNDLLQNRNSLFYKMVQQLGKEEVAVLTERAK